MTIKELSEIIDEEQYVWLVIDSVVKDEVMFKDIDVEVYGDMLIKKLDNVGNDLMAIVFK